MMFELSHFTFCHWRLWDTAVRMAGIYKDQQWLYGRWTTEFYWVQGLRTTTHTLICDKPVAGEQEADLMIPLMDMNRQTGMMDDALLPATIEEEQQNDVRG